MVNISKYLSDSIVHRTLSGNIVPQPDTPSAHDSLSRKVDYSVDFAVVHEV